MGEKVLVPMEGRRKMASRIPGMACPDLRATEGPEEKVGSESRACARFAPNFGPRSDCPTSQGHGAPQGRRATGGQGGRSLRAAAKPQGWSEMDQFGPKTGRFNLGGPWVEFRDSLLREEYSTHLASTM